MKEIIKNGTHHIFLRLNDFRGNNYIEEHRNVIGKYGYTWLLKMGKTINKEYLENIIEEKGGVILKSSAKRGNKFYYASLESTDISKDDKLIYPEYYEEYFNYEHYSLEKVITEGHWFKINDMIELSDENVNKFVINKGRKPMYECAIETRVVHTHIM